MAECRSCGAPIIWALTTAGRTMPLDPEPTTKGNVLIGGDRRARVLSDNPDGVLLYTSHFATCPQAAEHRRGG